MIRAFWAVLFRANDQRQLEPVPYYWAADRIVRFVNGPQGQSSATLLRDVGHGPERVVERETPVGGFAAWRRP